MEADPVVTQGPDFLAYGFDPDYSQDQYQLDHILRALESSTREYQMHLARNAEQLAYMGTN